MWVQFYAYPVVNGQVHLTVVAPDTYNSFAASDTIQLSHLSSANGMAVPRNVTYDSITITYQPVPVMPVITVNTAQSTVVVPTAPDGSYTATLSATTAVSGGAVTVTVGGTTLSTASDTGTVTAGPLIARTTGWGAKTAPAGSTYTVSVRPTDAYGNPETSLGTTLVSSHWNLSSGTLEGVSASSGTYTLTINPGTTTAGTTALTVYYGTTEVGTVSQTVTANVAQVGTVTLTPGTGSSTTIAVSWTAVTGAKSYHVYTSSTGTTGSWTLAGTVSSPSYTYPGTTAGATVYVEVAAVDTYNNVGEPSQSVHAKTPAAVAASISGGSMTAGSYTVSGTSYALASGTITVTDQYGQPMSGLTSKDLTVTSGPPLPPPPGGYYAAASTAPTTATNVFTLGTGSNGQYTLSVYTSDFAEAISGAQFSVSDGSASATLSVPLLGLFGIVKSSKTGLSQ